MEGGEDEQHIHNSVEKIYKWLYIVIPFEYIMKALLSIEWSKG